MKGYWFKTQIINKPKDPKDKLKGPIVEETEILKVDYSGKCEYSGTPLKEFAKLNHKLFFEDKGDD